MRAAKAAGVHVGRPRVVITRAQLERVRRGELRAAELAADLGCTAATVRRRLRELASRG